MQRDYIKSQPQSIINKCKLTARKRFVGFVSAAVLSAMIVFYAAAGVTKCGDWLPVGCVLWLCAVGFVYSEK